MNLQKIARRTIAAGIVAATAAVGFAGSAQAVSLAGCTATPFAPVFSHINAAGNKVLRYRVVIVCAGNRTITVQQQRKEQDGFLNPDDLVGTAVFSRAFPVAGVQTVNILATLPNTELGNEEMYQRIRIRVASGGVVSAWSAWDSSGVRSFSN